MLSLYELKPAFRRLLRPVAAALARAGVTANQVTISGGIVSAIAAAIVSFVPGTWLLLPGALLVRMALNAIDGILAKDFGRPTAGGALLNELTDVVSDAVLILPFATLPGWSPLWLGVFIGLAALSEMAGVLGLTIGASRRYDGPFGKSDRALVLGMLATWIGLGLPMPAAAGQWVPALCGAGCGWTVWTRSRAALGEIQSKRQEQERSYS